MKLYTVTGCIGAGKSTFSRNLAKQVNGVLLTEDFGENPYLKLYYDDMGAYAYPMQLWFLQKRKEQLLKARALSSTNVVVDQMLAAFGFVFPRIQHDLGHMSGEHFSSIVGDFNATYDDDRFKALFANELIIYLRVTEEQLELLQNRIWNRGRDFEKSIPLDYFKRLIEQYERWFENTPRDFIIVDAFGVEKESCPSIKQLMEDFKNEDLGKMSVIPCGSVG